MSGKLKRIHFGRGQKLLILIVVLGLCLGCYFLLTHLNKAKETAADTTVTAFSVTADDITAVSFGSGDKAISFSKTSGSWVYDGDSSFPLNETALTKTVSTLSSISAGKEITGVTDFSQYGLDHPACEVTLTSSGAGETTLAMGAENTLTGTYYFRVEGKSTVYLVSADVYKVFDCDLYDFVKTDTIPSLTDVSALTFDNRNGTTTFVHYPEGNDAWYSAEYTWFRQDGDSLIAADSDSVASLISALSGLTWSSCVAYNAGDDELAAYGLDDPVGTVKINYTETAYTDSGATDEEGNTLYNTNTADKTFTLLIGDSVAGDDETTYYYARPAGSDLVYLISGDSAETLLKVDDSTCPVWDLCKFDRTLLTSVKLSYNGSEASLKIKAKTATDSEGNETTSYTYKINGEKVDGGALLDDLDSIEAMKTTSTPEKAEGKASPALTLTFDQSRSGFETMVMTFTKYDDDYYLVTFNGSSALLLSAKDYGYIADDVEALLGSGE